MNEETGQPAGTMELTIRNELRRAVAHGILESAGVTFILLIAVSWYQAGPLAKSMVASSSSLGFLMAPLVVWTSRMLNSRASVASAVILLLGACGYLAAFAGNSLPWFVAGCMLGMGAASSIHPLVTQIYHDNYPRHRRGQLYSRSLIIRIGTCAIFSYLVGIVLDYSFSLFPIVLCIYCIASLASCFWLYHTPVATPVPSTDRHLFRGLLFARTDLLFRNTLICWMLLGFANLMMNPLRVEFLANPVYGLHLTAEKVALYVGVLPNLARLVLSPVWGFLFDRLNFFLVRVLVNLGFVIGIASFFVVGSDMGLIIGSISYGIANAGGDIAWGLWVTKIAPRQHVTDYMAAHTFFTGVRGIIAPLVGFSALTYVAPTKVGIFAMLLIIAASALLIPERKKFSLRSISNE